jgi:hypothetical protein
MRTIVHAITTAITLGAAAAMLASTPVLAAPSAKSMRAMMNEMKAKDPQSFAACMALARQRGYLGGDTGEGMNTGQMMFIDGCLMGKQR